MECGPLRHSPAGYAAFGRRAWLLEEHDARLPCGQRPCVCPVPPPVATERSVQLSFTADRTALFTAWNAVANLADMAGTVNVTLRAESQDGFDKGKLENGVMEPLREADLIE